MDDVKANCRFALMALFVVIFMVSLSSTEAKPPYKIRKLKYDNKKHQIWFDKSWRYGVPQIVAYLDTRKDIDSEQVFLHLYFYDKEKKLVASLTKPNNTFSYPRTGRVVGFGTPTSWKKRLEVVAQFAVPKKLRGKRKWKRALLVFGDDESAVAKSEPGGAVSDYDFPEKQQVLKSE